MRCSVPQRWRHFKGIVPHRLNKSFAFCFVGFIRAVILSIASACHAHARTVAASELLLRAAGQLEQGGVRAGVGARLGAVLDVPLVRTDQERVLVRRRGGEEVLVLLVDRFP